MVASFLDFIYNKPREKGPLPFQGFFLLLILLLPLPVFSKETISANSNELIILTRFRQDRKKTPETISIGATEFLNNQYSPASTFKSYLALSLLKNQTVIPSDKILCSDKHIPNVPRELNLREALFYSSNEYFEKVFTRLGKEKLNKTLIDIGYLPKQKSKPSDWWTDLEGLKHGGKIRKTPLEIHSYWVGLFKNGFGYPDELVSAWRDSLFWSRCDEKQAKVYGKTGSWEGNYWFQGALFFSDKKNYVIYTILNRDVSTSRTATIRRFYELVGCEMPSLE